MRQKLRHTCIDPVIDQLNCREKETQRLTIKLHWFGDQFVTMVMKEYTCNKGETKIFKPRPQPQNCIKFALLFKCNCGSYQCINGRLQYADIICLPFHYSASLPAYVMCFRVNQLLAQQCTVGKTHHNFILELLLDFRV